MNNTYLEVDLNKFINNINLIRKYVNGKVLIPVIKANAYGTYVNKKLDILNMFDIVAVAKVKEGVSIRKIGYLGDILVLNQPFYEEINEIKENNLVIGLSESTFLDKCIKNNDEIRVHIELETGMNRTGVFIDSLDEVCLKIKNSKIHVEGVYTHFSSADFDRNYTLKQIDKFKSELDIITKYHFNLKYIHSSASNGILNYSLDFTNAVRPGLIMYGYETFNGAKNIIQVNDICKLKSRIVYLKKVSSNTAIGYSQKFVCDRDMVVATISIGYADGFPRLLSNKGYVFINGVKASVIGNVCMDSIMVDVTDIRDVKVGDEVEIFGNNLSLDEFAEMCDTINYEALCSISDRVNRVFVGGEKYE